MAVKAKAEITLSRIVDISSITRYYLLQSSTSSTPSKPTANPPGGNWVTTEPSYTSGSTNTLYFVDLTILTNGSFSYSAVSKSSSYEAAKAAYNKAVNAQNGLDNLKIGGCNMLPNSKFDNDADGWTGNTAITDFTVKYGKKCAHINHSSLKNTKIIYQSILEKLEPNTQYTMSGWVLTENIVKGTTNHCIMFYCDGSYNNNGTATWYGYGSKLFPINTGTGTWQYLTWTFTTDETKLSNATSCNMYIYSRDLTGDVYFCNVKLEKGNRATDWSPAIEDMATAEGLESSDQAREDMAQELDERINEVQSSIEMLRDSISMMVQDENGASLMEQTADGWIFSMGETLSQLQEATDNLKTLETNLDTQGGAITALENVVNGLEELNNYVRITTDGDEPCIELGNEGSFKVRITNTAIQFIDGTSIPAYVSNQSLKIGKAEVEDELAFGGFAFAERSNGNMGLIWKGDS